MKNFTQKGYGYASDLRKLGRYYRHYHRLLELDHWRAVVSDRIYEVRYEAFVTNPEDELRRLVEFLGLDTHVNLLDENGGPLTWSYETAKAPGPINRSSIGIWRNYQSHLAPLIEELGELADSGPASAPEAAATS